MAPASNRLAIDLSGPLIRVVEGVMGGAMACGSAAVPDGALVAGKVANPGAVGLVLKQVLARTEVSQTRAMVAASDATATFRVLTLPASTTDREVEVAVTRELPLDPERVAIRWIDVRHDGEVRVVYAVAWDRAMIGKVAEAVKAAGVDPAVIELKSAALARTLPERSCVLLDLASEPVEIVLVDRHVPVMWHSFELSVPMAENAAPALAGPIRSLLRFHRRGQRSESDQGLPVLVSAEQPPSPDVLMQLAELVQQPVQSMNTPPRVPGHVRHPTYLACLGLLMRRST